MAFILKIISIFNEEARMRHSAQQGERRLGVFDATMIIVGSMIGSGIFIAPSIMAGWVQSPGLFLGLWAFGGIFTLLGALSYGELAAMSPKAGGQYVFLREAFGPFLSFLFGWTLFLVIQTGFNAAVSIAFAKYLGVFFPSLAEANVIFSFGGFAINTAQLIGCIVLFLLTAINCAGIQHGKFVQNFFTVTKVLALLVLIIVGFAVWKAGRIAFGGMFDVTLGPKAAGMVFMAALAVPLSKALFAYDAWNTATFVAEEVRSPEKSIPKALFWGTLLTTIIYILTNMAYIVTLSLPAMAVVNENRIGQVVGQMLFFGDIGNTLIILAILISTFGCVNGLILSGARVCYAMARDGLFFRSCAKLHPTRKTPVKALIYQGIWSGVLVLTGSYNELLTYTTFAAVLFGALTVFGVFVLRVKQPARPRPYKCFAYPLTPALYLLIAIPFLIYVVVGDPVSTGLGLMLVLTGVPVYYWWRRSMKASEMAPDELAIRNSSI